MNRAGLIFASMPIQDITEDDFIDVIDGNRKYCKCSFDACVAAGCQDDAKFANFGDDS